MTFFVSRRPAKTMEQVISSFSEEKEKETVRYEGTLRLCRASATAKGLRAACRRWRIDIIWPATGRLIYPTLLEFDSLATNQTLQGLSQFYYFTCDGVLSLASALKHNRCLRSLALLLPIPQGVKTRCTRCRPRHPDLL